MAGFETEDQLVRAFCSLLDSRGFLGETCNWFEQFDYRRGKPDVVLSSAVPEVIAIEAKLSRWREALHQATRNLCFADLAFVLLPEDRAHVAMRYEAEFRDRGIGLLVLGELGLREVFPAGKNDPCQGWLNQLALQKLRECNNVGPSTGR